MGCTVLQYCFLRCSYSHFPKISSKLPWHPIYVGLGAYGGFEVDSLDDNVSYELFYEKTSHRMKTNIQESHGTTRKYAKRVLQSNPKAR